MDDTVSLDAIEEALELQRRAALEPFDWTDMAGVWDKLSEEIEELKQAPDAAGRFEELGDLLFMLVNLSRHLDADPAAALRAASRKFDRRFGFILDHSASLPPPGGPLRLEAMEALWNEAKRRERASSVPGGRRLEELDVNIR